MSLTLTLTLPPVNPRSHPDFPPQPNFTNRPSPPPLHPTTPWHPQWRYIPCHPRQPGPSNNSPGLATPRRRLCASLTDPTARRTAFVSYRGERSTTVATAAQTARLRAPHAPRLRAAVHTPCLRTSRRTLATPCSTLLADANTLVTRPHTLLTLTSTLFTRPIVHTPHPRHPITPWPARPHRRHPPRRTRHLEHIPPRPRRLPRSRRPDRLRRPPPPLRPQPWRRRLLPTPHPHPSTWRRPLQRRPIIPLPLLPLSIIIILLLW